MLGEHQDRDARVLPADLRGRDEPVVAVAGRHAHVHDRDIRQMGAHLQEQIARVRRAADHLVAGRSQERGDAGAHQRVIVSDDHAQRAPSGHEIG